ncbi:DUF4031 domain-containing protein [Mycetocola zhujimingii]|uniref:DUF4031 domain-containing protein n=1 Tax=Mycetocola zhujimingii TaxID=2079792 RepID=A0A2U1TH41_9MICO|nr:DUF4031 domain-containing protein [Mycetocola zhujimingii]AWB86650.1 DUF4031 domain-containing protein [Mycetocola zhujimingii]PWC08188.1 DUF4031 domain-containing protein [Mycetocola zhujimingii]
MTVLIDTPLWPAHNTLWSHLISDVSLDELHAFAARHSLPRRSFDLDHYDVPQERFEELVAGGAVPVSANVLVRRLIESNLRVTAKERKRRSTLG